MKEIKRKIKNYIDRLNSKMTQVRRELLILGNSKEGITKQQHGKKEMENMKE